MKAILHRHPDDELTTHLREWTAEGIVSEQQAAAIAEIERARAGRRGGLSTASEVTIYVGLVLALVTGAVVVGRFFDDLHAAGRLALFAALTAAGLGVGALVGRIGEAATDRVRSVLWLVGSGGAVGVTLQLERSAGVHHGGLMAIGAGLVVGALGAGLWRNRPRPLQLLTALGGVVATGAGLAAWGDVRPDFAGLALWAGALALLAVASTGRIHPAVTATRAAAIGALVGPWMVVMGVRGLGPAIGVVTAVGIVALGTIRHERALSVIGVVGLLAAATRLVAIWFHSTASLLVVALLALVAVVVALERTLRQRGGGSPPS